MNFNNTAPMTNTRDAILASLARRNADTPTFIMPDRPADRSRNGQRTPRSVPRRNYR